MVLQKSGSTFLNGYSCSSTLLLGRAVGLAVEVLGLLMVFFLWGKRRRGREDRLLVQEPARDSVGEPQKLMKTKSAGMKEQVFVGS